MNYSKIPLAQTVVTLCKTHNIKHIVISPGSRNAPLTIGFTHDDFFKCYSIVDERCAAFFAMGIAQQNQEPTAVVCTSGSALLNYYPAVSEAYYSRIPLVVLSADRPEHLIDIGDGQTIKQKNVFGEHVFYSANLKLDLREETHKPPKEEVPIFKNLENKVEKILGLQDGIQSQNEKEIHKALNSAVINSGPVHINVPFDEPLYGRVDELTISPKPFKLPNIEKNIEDSVIKECSNIWKNSKRKLVLVGVLQPNSVEQNVLDQLVKDEGVIVLTETTSNLYHQDVFPGIDKLIAPLDKEDFQKLQPEVLLTLGGLIVSKKVKRFLRDYKPNYHWHIDKYNANDTFFALDKHIKLSPNTFFESFLPEIKDAVKSDYKQYWLSIRERRRKLHDDYLSTIPYSDFTVFDYFLNSIPRNSQLQVGNSSAIRYTQLFQLRQDISVFCNRGTSGIDGSTSTALGSASISKERVTFITGDLSFFYDSNALWNNYIPKNFRIIVLNNCGGGIFRILPGHKNTDNFDTYFETKHNLNASDLSKMYGFEYQSADSNEALKKELTSFYDDSNQPKLLEVFTPSQINDEILLNYFEFIK
ncbi:2-succinyl-5-enolpyruvyl-6-hydroxy-3-cyclohexene-1-carboxylic-acid synthase [Winogradskyella sp. PC-19]|uniref:2-succinyl-5-enolpyruvyl-6-hydroxy-3- cyclohexene-1-carboxylic-acid synthase n=1 Tax=unclassified Winogradskyella TaxID=2615021 RepID=UPI000B3D36C3|nr:MULTISPECIES: 2-succinyl-5-enolpyruvyl-6-hydroxy-3-cyclohexene-1-carboxylic-acid synthase [unclassified Winogradskyella]ARV08776.1 2-succinyl-5-enolpyruvyl-6-hydroxy-3-cyclohexene-1-carboxylic-acid synthase [Winogradskyella sp. PC-19]RZN77881.1 MAG: 2-succinyl-5-enolpyruvyl-6-hydroxy-3-cyclohexene-1-carboxylic-acid synthase [Winogradskyella sp.]